jgi:hypothetical protein
MRGKALPPAQVFALPVGGGAAEIADGRSIWSAEQRLTAFQSYRNRSGYDGLGRCAPRWYRTSLVLVGSVYAPGLLLPLVRADEGRDLRADLPTSGGASQTFRGQRSRLAILPVQIAEL